jgi:hypothetical protein
MAKSSFPHRGMFAVRFALNVFLGSTFVWATLADSPQAAGKS